VNDQETEMSNDTVGSDGIFLRASDKTRFDYVMRAVRENSASMALSSDSEGVLDHYGRMVLAKLRKTDGLQVEVFLPQNTEQLLERFNQILSDISIDDARRAEDSPAPRRVLIAHDAKAINKRDLQLIARLVQDFPGANVSLVMLIDRTGMILHERTLDSFGQRLLRWPVETPTRTEGDSLLKLGRTLGFEVEVKKVLAATGYAEMKIAPKKKEKEKTTEPSTAQARFETQLAAARNERKRMEEAEEAERQTRTEPTLNGPAQATPTFTEPAKKPGLLGKLVRWTAAMVLLLVVSAGVVLLLFSQNLSPVQLNSPILKDNLPPWAMEAAIALVGKPPTAQLEDAKAAEAAEAAKAADTAAAAAPTVPAPAADSSSVKVDSVATGSPEPSAQAETKAEPTVPAQNAEPAKAEAKPEAKPDASKPADALAPRSERGVDQLVRQARPGSFFVQHVSLGSMAEAQEWRAQYGPLSAARIVAVNTQDKGVKFAVISGPFATRKEAETFAGRQGVPSNPWLRPVKSLQSALLPATR